MENKHKHLEFIQAAINRMAGNLFLLKGWTITLIAGLFALSEKDTNQIYLLIAYFPTLTFWALDAYFLSLERRFRSLYEDVRGRGEAEIDFSMDTRPFKTLPDNSWWDAFTSTTLRAYYGSLLGVMIVLMLAIRCA